MRVETWDGMKCLSKQLSADDRWSDTKDWIKFFLLLFTIIAHGKLFSLRISRFSSNLNLKSVIQDVFPPQNPVTVALLNIKITASSALENVPTSTN